MYMYIYIYIYIYIYRYARFRLRFCPLCVRNLSGSHIYRGRLCSVVFLVLKTFALSLPRLVWGQPQNPVVHCVDWLSFNWPTSLQLFFNLISGTFTLDKLRPTLCGCIDYSTSLCLRRSSLSDLFPGSVVHCLFTTGLIFSFVHLLVPFATGSAVAYITPTSNNNWGDQPDWVLRCP